MGNSVWLGSGYRLRRAGRMLGWRLMISVVTLLVLVLVFEVGMRLLGLGKPDASLRGYDRGPVRYRADGSRQNPWTQGHTNVLRVAVIGDSVSNGAGVGKDDAYAQRLARLLNMNEGVPPAEVWLYAKGGTATYQQLRFLDLALQRQPHLVILGISLNDTEDWTRASQLRAWRDERLPRVPAPALARLLRHSRFLNWLYRRLETRRNLHAYLRHHQRLFDPEYSGWRRFVSALETFAARCAAADAQLVALIFPDLSQMEKPRYPLDFAHAQIHEALRAAQIPFLDYQADFAGKDPYRLTAVPGVDGHPNEIAHRIIAESLLEFLLANDLLDHAYLPRNRSGSERRFWESLSARMYDPVAAPTAPQEGPSLDEDLAGTPDPE
ncbi:MAG: SGNH/GDSL hydrolase family protein [Candidatus Marinimicrobia bacterium]|nr:SGNH/GDSL hydrolase family protein [Candidatus Neomarinimicrobiota bacterium]